MKILAVDFSTDRRSVAVLDGEVVKGRAEEAGTRASHPFQLIEAALAQAGWEREAIECFALGIGPGSYTGIRAAISIAQGLELARGIKLLPVSSVECLAAQARMEEVRGKVGVVVDAQRREFYLAEYEIGDCGILDGAPLKIATREETVRCETDGALLIGPEVSKWFPKGKVIFPEAAMIGKLAALRTDFLPGEKLEPIYLRETNFVKAPPLRVIPM